jgi:hypothetical protein
MTDLTRWTVKVSKETDVAVRSYLAERGGRKGDLSKFIERAVRREVLRTTVRDIQERNGDLPAAEVQALIEEACAAVRGEFWPDRLQLVFAAVEDSRSVLELDAKPVTMC